jgi:hypothetical protein
MRKVVAGAVAAAALTWAQGIRADDASNQQQKASDPGQAQTSREMRAEERVDKDPTLIEGGRAESSQAQARGDSGQRGEKKHLLFEGKKNFDVYGKVTQVSPDRITIQRDDLPAATLHVSPNTKIEMDGKQVSTQELTRGQDVKASFNLQGEKPEALEIKAQRTGAQKDQQKDHQKELQKILSGESR